MNVVVLKESSGVRDIVCTVSKFCMFPLLIHSSLQSSVVSVVDHSTNLELQEANTRLRERLARMVMHTKRQLYTHMHPKLSKQTYCTRRKESASHTGSISNREMCSKLRPKENSHMYAQKLIPPR